MTKKQAAENKGMESDDSGDDSGEDRHGAKSKKTLATAFQ